MRRKVVGIMILLSLSALLAFSGGQKEAGAAKGAAVEINWTEWWDNEWSVQFMETLLADFQKLKPAIKVNRIHNPWFDCYNKTLALAQAGTPADVMGMEGIWMSALDKLGALEDLGPWYTKEGAAYKNRFVEPALVQYQGKIKSVYMYVYPFAIAYNPNLVTAKGLTPPKNLNEFKSDLAKLREPAKNIYGTALPLSAEASYHIMMIFGLTLAQYGGTYVNADGTAAFNSAAGRKAVAFLKSLVDEKLVAPGPLGMTATETREYFSAERIAFTYDGPFIAVIAAQTNKTIKPAFVPQMKTESSAYIVGGSGLSMSAKSSHKQQAWEFIKYMMSDEIADRMMRVTKLPWGIKGIEKNDFIKADPILRECPAMINDPKTLIFPVTPEADRVQRSFAENIQAALSGAKGIDEALATAESEWNALVK
jgi:multiple sugar transport system substrate-binding protein